MKMNEFILYIYPKETSKIKTTKLLVGKTTLKYTVEEKPINSGVLPPNCM